MGFIRGLAAEVGAHGVTANCVSLGTMKTGAFAEALETEPRARGQAGPAATRCPRLGRARGPGRAGRAAVQRRRGVDHRPGVPGRRRLRLRALDPARSGADGSASPVLERRGRSRIEHASLAASCAGLDASTTVADGAGVTFGPMATRRRSKSSRGRRSKVAALGAGGARRSGPPGVTTSTTSSRDHRTDALAIVLAVLGRHQPCSAIYSDLAGPVGRAHRPRRRRGLLGGGRFLLPLALIVGAVALLVPARRTRRRRGRRRRRREAGAAGGSASASCSPASSIVGLLHLGRDDRRWTARSRCSTPAALVGAAVGRAAARPASGLRAR